MKQQILILPGQLFPYRYFKKVHVILPFNLFWRGSVFAICDFFFYSVYFDVLLLCSFLFCVYFYFYFFIFFAFTLCVISSCYICVSTAVVIFFSYRSSFYLNILPVFNSLWSSFYYSVGFINYLCIPGNSPYLYSVKYY
jgi:hypothetical protein